MSYEDARMFVVAMLKESGQPFQNTVIANNPDDAIGTMMQQYPTAKIVRCTPYESKKKPKE